MKTTIDLLISEKDDLKIFMHYVETERNRFCGFIHSRPYDPELWTLCQGLLFHYDNMADTIENYVSEQKKK
jgi:hypothetical protein